LVFSSFEKILFPVEFLKKIGDSMGNKIKRERREA
jgi:hypothetical protein